MFKKVSYLRRIPDPRRPNYFNKSKILKGCQIPGGQIFKKRHILQIFKLSKKLNRLPDPHLPSPPPTGSGLRAGGLRGCPAACPPVLLPTSRISGGNDKGPEFRILGVRSLVCGSGFQTGLRGLRFWIWGSGILNSVCH